MCNSLKKLRSFPLLLCVLSVGCATYTKVEPTQIIQAQSEIPEEELLDVGIEIFGSESGEESDEDDIVFSEIREAEARFIPYHLKNTLQATGQWGAVWVIPSDSHAVDVSVKGEMVESNGEFLTINVHIEDASGEVWFTKTYKAKARERSYRNNEKGKKDAFQDAYNIIANDMVAFKDDLSRAEIQNIRRISKLKFASDLAPDAFEGYLSTGNNGSYAIAQLPARDDPMMARMLQIREREYMLIDTVNEHYFNFYDEMWDPYESWRRASRDEAVALRNVKRSARNRKLLGAAAVAGAILLEALGHGGSVPTVPIAVGGVVAYSSGVEKAKEAEIHVEALRELGESFDSEVAPLVVEVEGETLELTGSAEAQYAEWRRLLKQIYASEVGFAPDAESASEPTPAQPIQN